jgi:hypothetical protein
MGAQYRQNSNCQTIINICSKPGRTDRLVVGRNVTLTDWLTAKLLLAVASTVILGSESHRTHDHILLSGGSGSLQTPTFDFDLQRKHFLGTDRRENTAFPLLRACPLPRQRVLPLLTRQAYSVHVTIWTYRLQKHGPFKWTPPHKTPIFSQMALTILI